LRLPIPIHKTSRYAHDDPGDLTVLQENEVSKPWWKTLDKPRPYAFVLLVTAGLFFEIVVHYYFQFAAVYTHVYYLIIVLAGVWYGKKAIWIALFFGGLHIVVTYITLGIISPDALIRALMFIIVAFVVGTIVDLLNLYRAQLETRNRELTEINIKLESSQKAYETANKKLKLLSSVTRHDIRNQLTAVLGYIDLSKMTVKDTEVLTFLNIAEASAHTILRQIKFTKNYEEVGVHAPQWWNVPAGFQELKPMVSQKEIELSVSLDDLSVFADPLIEKVFENLIDNSLRHGKQVRRISVSYMTTDQNELFIVYEDDGTGVRQSDKERIFEMGFGVNTGQGLFLSREILSMTGLTITENGIPGKGARFEIRVPQGKFQGIKGTTSPN
jgi:signal transduction histidine kinase